MKKFYPIITEKAMKLMQEENKMVFIVERKLKKEEIKKQVEEIFKTKVLKVNTLITPNGMKKAYVKLSPETLAMDIATQLGVL